MQHLKDAAISFYKKNNLTSFIKTIKNNYPLNYTQDVLKKRKKKKVKRKKTVNKSSSVSSYRSRLTTSSLKKKEIRLSWPLDKSKFWISSYFGPRKKPNGMWKFHYALDLAALRGTPIKAACTGIVIEARYAKGGYGKTIVLAHSRKYKTRYAHLDSINVKVGQKVGRGQVVGRVGATGLVWASGKDPSHLHFEVHVFGKQVNPLPFLV